MTLSVCRVCLATNRRMKIIANTQLQTIFEKLTSNQLITGDGRPESVCYLCHLLLQRCCKFVDLSQKVEKFITQLISNRIVLTQKNMDSICKSLQTETFTVSKTTFVSVPKDFDDIKSNVVIKVDPDAMDKCDTKDISEIADENEIKETDTKNIQELSSDADGNSDYSLTPSKTYKRGIHCIEIDVKDPEPNITKKELRETVTSLNKHNKTTGDIKNDMDEITLNCEKNPDENEAMETDTYDEELSLDVERNSDTIMTPTKQYKKGINYIEIDMKDPVPNIQTTKELSKTAISLSTPNNKLTADIKNDSDKITFNCDKCPKKFKQKAYFKRHARVHTGEKPYSCNICGETFIDSVVLKQHIRTHSGEAPYICYVCSKSFNQKPHLIEHIRTHTGEKPHACQRCCCTFAHKGSLKRHMRTHTGEKPYVCHKCSRQFSQISNLQKHIRTCKIDKCKHQQCDKCSQAQTLNQTSIPK